MKQKKEETKKILLIGIISGSIGAITGALSGTRNSILAATIATITTIIIALSIKGMIIKE